MTSDDTFFGGPPQDRTALRPSPGGRRSSATPAPRATTEQAVPSLTNMLSAGKGAQINPLVSAAAPLLTLASQLRTLPEHENPESLFQHVSQEIGRFSAAATAAGVSSDSVQIAQYMLCTFVDESVLATPWGHQSQWVNRTLLNAFHNDGRGGEKFFQVLDRLLQEPKRHLDLLELMYACLALGFEGKFRIQDGGQTHLDRAQSALLGAIRDQRGDYETALSPNWRGAADLRSPLAKYIPLWVVAAIAAGVCVLVFVGFLLALNRHSDPVAIEMSALGRNIPALVEREAYVVPMQVTLRDLLAPEAQQGLLEIDDASGASKVTLKGDGLFASGRGDVAKGSIELLNQIAAALAQLPGQVLVTGHTDDVPIRTIRYPSNWHLSKQRAESVADILIQTVEAERVLAEPRAENEPRVPNTSAQNRARNRRVEITLFPAPGQQ